MIDLKGTLYGTTGVGGDGGCLFRRIAGCGTVFSVTTTGTEKLLYSFTDIPDGSHPGGGLINVKSTLYGATGSGGSSKCGGCGTVFSVKTTGTEKVLYSFRGGHDGSTPSSSLTNMNGTLYGTTEYGGANNSGTVFSVSRSGREKVLYSFCSQSSCSDGARPQGGLINVNGTLYGVTQLGGANGHGIVFSLTTAGVENVVYAFRGGSDGATPWPGLIAVSGTLYGTTVAGGGNGCTTSDSSGCGTVYSVSTGGLESILYRFCTQGSCSDGAVPFGGLLYANGELFGTTYEGGSSGVGTVYSIDASGTETVLHSFAGGLDGVAPIYGLINVGGTLYGTTPNGGGQGCHGLLFSGCGTVFALTP